MHKLEISWNAASSLHSVVILICGTFSVAVDTVVQAFWSCYVVHRESVFSLCRQFSCTSLVSGTYHDRPCRDVVGWLVVGWLVLLFVNCG